MNPSRHNPKMAQYLLAAVGNTPLVELDFLEEIPKGVRLFAKLETTNPGGSIKDRRDRPVRSVSAPGIGVECYPNCYPRPPAPQSCRTKPLKTFESAPCYSRS